VAGAGRIKNNGAVSHIRFHQVLTGIHGFGNAGLLFYSYTPGISGNSPDRGET
jgi:hypothetical protein